MKIKLINSIDESNLALSYNKKQNPKNMKKVANLLAHRELGHNKFLNFIVVFLEIEAPRYWWQQFDAYKVGITSSSNSTMHTLMQDIEGDCSYLFATDDKKFIKYIVEKIKNADSIEEAKSYLPECFLQKRLIVTNYRALRNMYQQRKNHNLPEWKFFCNFLKTLKDSQYITKARG